MVSARTPISNSSSLFNKPLWTVPSSLITISFTVTFMFYNFFSFPARSKYVSLTLFSLIFTLWSTGKDRSTILSAELFFIIISLFQYWALYKITKRKNDAHTHTHTHTHTYIYIYIKGIVPSLLLSHYDWSEGRRDGFLSIPKALTRRKTQIASSGIRT